MTVDATATAAERELLHACFEAARAHPFYRARYRDCRGIDDAPAIDKRDLLPALQAKAAQHGYANHPDLVELAQLIERRLAQRPLAQPVLQQLLATYSAQLDYLDGGAR